MTSKLTLASVGLLIAATTIASAAPPTLRVTTGGARPGQTTTIDVIGVVNGTDESSKIQGAELTITYDATKFDTVTAAAATGYGSQINTGTPGTIRAALNNTTATGQTATGPLLTLTLTPKATNAPLTGDTIRVATGSRLTDGDYNDINVTGQGGFLPGKVRNVGAIQGSPSVGVVGGVKVIAVGSGTSLKLLNADTLADIAGFAPAALPGNIISRPVFGTLGADQVILVGTENGSVAAYNAATGAPILPPTSVGSRVPSAPVAATSDAGPAVYVAADQASGAPKLLRFAAGSTTPAEAVLSGATAVTGSPAVYSNGLIVVGSNAGLHGFRWDATAPGGGAFTQAFAAVADPDGFTAPVFTSGGSGPVALVGTRGSAAKVYQIGSNGTPGTNNLSLGANTGPLSEGFPETGGAIFGGASGNVYRVVAGASAPTSGSNVLGFLTNPVLSQPLSIGGKIYAVDNLGNFKATGTTEFNIGGTPTKAIAATNAPENLIVVTNGNGDIASMPM